MICQPGSVEEAFQTNRAFLPQCRQIFAEPTLGKGHSFSPASPIDAKRYSVTREFNYSWENVCASAMSTGRSRSMLFCCGGATCMSSGRCLKGRSVCDPLVVDKEGIYQRQAGSRSNRIQNFSGTPISARAKNLVAAVQEGHDR